MTDTILVLIKSNPLKSHRAVEGLRIALGLVSGGHPVAVVLLNQAPLLLAEDTEDLVEGDILQKYLPTFKELGQTFFVEENFLKRVGPNQTGYSVEAVSYDGINELVQQAGCSIIF